MEAIGFTVREEPWIRYKLEDGTVLLARFVMTKAYRSEDYDPSGQPIYAWSSQTILTTLVDKEKKGTPSQPPPTSSNPSDYSGGPVDFDRVGPEQWNIYELEDGTLLRMKLEITNIMKTDKFAADGDPFYIISSQVIPRVKVPPKLIRKPTVKVSRGADIYK